METLFKLGFILFALILLFICGKDWKDKDHSKYIHSVNKQDNNKQNGNNII